MNVNQVVRTITIKGVSDGVEKLTSDVNKLAAAQQNVAVVSETSARRVLSLEDAWKKQTLKLDEAARSQANIARESKIADGALREGLITQQQHAERLNLIAQRYAVATVQAGKFAGQTGLNRYELLNLSRQLQDVGVSLASGQSPFVVLTQQGSQILDVFQASTGSVRGFFTQAIGWAGRFVTSTAGAVTGAVGIGAAALYAASSWSSGQREIDKALIGIGQRSGATADSINKIAEASAASSRLSVSESRTAALEFVKTGNIYTENIGALVGLVKGHAVAIGESSEDAAKQLAKIFGGDIGEGVDKLNAVYGSISGATRQYAIELDILGKRQEAVALIAKNVAPAIQRAADVTGFWATSWDFVSNKSSNTFDAIGKGLSKLTGIGLSREDRLASAQSALRIGESGLGDQRELAAKIGPDLVPGLKQAEQAVIRLREEVAKLQAEIAGGAAETNQSRILKIGQDADMAVRALVPFIEQLEKVAKAQELIRKAQGTPGAQQGLAGSNAEAARAAEVMSLHIKNTKEETDRANVVALQLMETYKTSSREIAIMRAGLADQLVAASAVGGQARLAAQEQATYNDLIRQGRTEQDAAGVAAAQRAVAQAQITTQAKEQAIALQNQLPVMAAVTGQQQIQAQYQATINQMVHDGVPLVQAIAVAEAQRASSLAQANAEADRMLRNLQQQGELLQAASQFDKDRIAAAHTLQNLLDRGVDAEKARAVAGQQLRNADLARQAQEAADAERDAATAAERHARANQAAAAAAERNAQAAAEAQRRWEAAAASLKFLPFYLLDTMGAMDKLFNSNQTGKSQFNPEGYTSKAPTPMALISSRKYGPNGVDSSGQPTPAGMQFYFDAMLQKSGGNLGVAVNSLLGGGLMTAGGLGSRAVLDSNRVSLLNRAIDILPQNQQVAAIQQEIGLLGSAPPSLESAELIKQLNDKLRQLTEATEENTAATSVMTDVLSPFYSSDPRRTHLGFRAFAGGGIMTPWGELPVNKYDQGGVATSPQIAVFGEGRTAEAYVPIPNGRIEAIVKTPANSNEQQGQRPIIVNTTINVQGNADAGTVAALKQTAYQQAQAMRRVIG